MAKRSNPDFLNGIPELLILRLLAERPMHGYELVQSIRRASGEQLQFGEGCIYPLLHRLEDERLLASRHELVGGRDRLVYRTTKAGCRKLAETEKHWRCIVGAVEMVLRGNGGEHGSALASSVA